ncbi:MAG: hypothetical protein ACLTK0_05590 [Anaerovoracaceae bacterium]
MALAKDYDSVMGRANEIMKKALGLDYNDFESGSVAFDYEALMKATGYTLDEVAKIQARTAVGSHLLSSWGTFPPCQEIC